MPMCFIMRLSLCSRLLRVCCFRGGASPTISVADGNAQRSGFGRLGIPSSMCDHRLGWLLRLVLRRLSTEGDIMHAPKSWALSVVLGVALVFGLCNRGLGAETVKIGLQKLAGNGRIFLAVEKGYFAAEGLNAELRYFPQPEQIPLALVSGDLDFGAVGISAGFYNLAGQGAVKIVAPGIRDAPGFKLFAAIASNRAATGGLASYKDLPGHNFAALTAGASTVYTLSRIAEKDGFDLKSIRVLALQSQGNVLSAIAGGQADAAIIGATLAMPAIGHGDAKLLGFTGDAVYSEAGATMVATRTADKNADTVKRFLRAIARGRSDYVAAFIGADGKPKDGPSAPEALAIIAKYVDQPVELVKLSISYVDPEGRFDVADVLRQIAWYKSQGFVKPEIEGKAIIDTRYIVPLAEK
jgi:NitT/TauT family transport system substrate-binding protein